MEKSNTREEIVEETLELFAVNGYDAIPEFIRFNIIESDIRNII